MQDRHAARCEALAAKAAAAAWDPARDLDWGLAPSRPWWLPRRHHVTLVSQFLHGEAAALAACRRLHATLPPGPARAALAAQVADEARHVEAYTRYLARLGDLAPPRPLLARAFETLAGWDGQAVGLILATHVVLESEALAIQQALAERFPCPLLGQISRRAGQDEARHLALGRTLLQAAGLAARPLDERVALHRRLAAFWAECVAAAAADHGTVFARVVPATRVAAKWRGHHAAFRRVGLIGPGEDAAFA